MACMSESKFYKTFRLETGLSPNEYVIEQRLKTAEHLLHQDDISIKEVYLACGFSSFAYFSTLFKKRRNMSPTEYKLQ
jgi:AraC family transcriptional regulator